MIKRETLKVTTPQSNWEVMLPQGAYKARPLAAYDVNGDSHQWDSWSYIDNRLLVSFGVDTVAGELEYEYQIDKTVVEDKDKPLVNIEANYGGVNIGSGIFQ